MTVTVVIRITTTAILFRSYLSVNSNHQKRMSILLIPKGGMISEQFALMSSVEIFVDCIADMVNDQYFRIIGDDTFSVLKNLFVNTYGFSLSDIERSDLYKKLPPVINIKTK